MYLETINGSKSMDDDFNFLKVLKQWEERRQRRRSPSCLTVDQLKEILSFKPLKAERDLSYVLKTDINFNMLSKGQEKYLLQRDRFKHWFGPPVQSSSFSTATSRRLGGPGSHRSP